MTATDAARRSRIITRSALVGTGTNALLAASKIALGLLTGAGAITADGVNNASDTLSSLITWVTGRMVKKPGDLEHPYGHGRMEYISTLLIGIVVLLMGWELLTSGIRTILSPKPLSLHPLTLVLLPISILVKLGISIAFHRIGKREAIPTLVATSIDSAWDVVATSTVLLGLLLENITGWQLDGYLSVAVSLLVLRAGWTLCKEMVDTLLGGGDNRGLATEIMTRIKACPGILGVHGLRIHDYGPGRIIASIHAEVDASEKLEDIHQTIDQAERDIGAALQLELIIHLDPVVRDDPERAKLIRLIEDYLHTVDSGMTLHDFRRECNQNKTVYTFDVEVPPIFSDEAGLTQGVCAFIREMEPGATCVLKVARQMYGDEG